MGLFRGIGARKDSVRGTSPIEVRKVLAGLFASTGGISARPGILPGGDTPLVTGNSTWAYNVGLFHAFTSYSAGDGGQVYGNDTAALIGTTGVGSTVPVAPGTGLQRIDIVWTRHPTNTENTDTSSEPLFGVASGVAASSSPVAPTIPVGALELGRNTMTSAATNTASAGNTITQSAPYTALRGAPVPCRNQAERDALTAYNGLPAYRLDLHRTETYNGTTWAGDDTGWLTCTAAAFSASVVRARAVNGQVTVTGWWAPAAGGTLGSSYVTVATLPPGTHPLGNMVVQMATNTGMNVYCSIGSSGQIQILPFTGGTAYTTAATFSLNGLTWRND